MVNRTSLLLTAALLAALAPALAQAADKPVASAAIPPAPYVARPHPRPPPPPIPKESALQRLSPAAQRKLRPEHERHVQQTWTRRFHRHLRHEPHRAVVHIDRPPPAPATAPPPRYYAGAMPPSDWQEAPAPGWYGYYPAPPWRRRPMPW